MLLAAAASKLWCRWSGLVNAIVEGAAHSFCVSFASMERNSAGNTEISIF